MWDILEIAPTEDALAIRRAYAACLKKLDVEKNPAAFIRLRQAYEEALAAPAPSAPEENPQGFHEPEECRTITVPARVPLSVDDYDDDEYDTLALKYALEEEDVAAAYRHYIALSASGAIGLGEQQAWAEKVVALALSYDSLPQKEFLEIAALLGPPQAARPDAPELRAEIQSRIAAHAWCEGLEKTAAQWAWGKKRHTILAARVFLGKNWHFYRSRASLTALTATFKDYKSHWRWLPSRFNGYRLTPLEQRLERAIKRKALRDKLYIIAVLTFLAADALYVLISKFFP
jgi:hypothetical protein